MTVVTTITLFFFVSAPMRGACVRGKGCTQLLPASLFRGVRGRSITVAPIVLGSISIVPRAGPTATGGGSSAIHGTSMMGPITMGRIGIGRPRGAVGTARAGIIRGAFPCRVVVTDMTGAGSTRTVTNRLGTGKCANTEMLANSNGVHIDVVSYTSHRSTGHRLLGLERGRTCGGT